MLNPDVVSWFNSFIYSVDNTSIDISFILLFKRVDISFIELLISLIDTLILLIDALILSNSLLLTFLFDIISLIILGLTVFNSFSFLIPFSTILNLLVSIT